MDILDEFNPLKDMEIGMIDFHGFHDESLSKEERARIRREGYHKFALMIVKPFLRGQIYGGALGAAYALLTNNDMSQCVYEGGRLGMWIDLAQYNVRFDMEMPRPPDFL